MKLTTLKIAIAAVGLLTGAGIAYSGAADDTIKARQTCMKSNGAIMATVVPMFKEEKPFDAAALKAVVDGMGAACSGWATFWGADTQTGETVETFAKAEIWTNAAGFEAAGNASYGAMQKLAAVTDLAGLKAAFPAVGEGCKGCHDKFRRPKQ